MIVRNFKDLRDCKKFIKLSAKIYRPSKNFPKSGQFGLTQVLGARPLISANIAEGSVGAIAKGKPQFSCMSYGLLETKNFTYLNKVDRYFNRPILDKLLSEIEELRILLNRFTRLTKRDCNCK